MLLYHAATVQIRQPSIIQAERGRDFGFGFYTTADKGRAERWANQNALILARQAPQAVKAIVNIYRFNPNEKLKIKRFAQLSPEWLEWVRRERTQSELDHDFDLITGAIADEAVGALVTRVSAGRISPEKALEQLVGQELHQQWTFCTQQALELLKFQSHYELEIEND